MPHGTRQKIILMKSPKAQQLEIIDAYSYNQLNWQMCDQMSAFILQRMMASVWDLQGPICFQINEHTKDYINENH